MLVDMNPEEYCCCCCCCCCVTEKLELPVVFAVVESMLSKRVGFFCDSVVDGVAVVTVLVWVGSLNKVGVVIGVA